MFALKPKIGNSKIEILLYVHKMSLFHNNKLLK